MNKTYLFIGVLTAFLLFQHTTNNSSFNQWFDIGGKYHSRPQFNKLSMYSINPDEPTYKPQLSHNLI